MFFIPHRHHRPAVVSRIGSATNRTCNTKHRDVYSPILSFSSFPSATILPLVAGRILGLCRSFVCMTRALPLSLVHSHAVPSVPSLFPRVNVQISHAGIAMSSAAIVVLFTTATSYILRAIPPPLLSVLQRDSNGSPLCRHAPEISISPF